ncbi:hypothetical protein [Sphingomonas sp. TZW2008]|uniref:hypothetical protein n=1 Tax=Sphingomonas sp. TZW2008 TaxID=1917973 RepID=UPI000A26A317|nr:hypothetical protein [Sphingomonas sp. TZW2008]
MLLRFVTVAAIASSAKARPLSGARPASCLLVGDSTIVGTAEAIRASLGVACDVQAREGVATSTILRWQAPAGSYRVAVIGSGSNDAGSPRLSRDLALLRGAVHADRVIWLRPYDRAASAAIGKVADAHGDATVDLASFPSRDRLHPANYVAVARAIAALPLPPARPGATVVAPPAPTAASPATPALAGRHVELVTAF